MQFRVSVIGGPKIQGDGGEFVHNRDGTTVFGEVNCLDIGVTSVAGFEAYVREFPGGIDGELMHVLFATSGADNPAKIPLVRAQGAN